MKCEHCGQTISLQSKIHDQITELSMQVIPKRLYAGSMEFEEIRNLIDQHIVKTQKVSFDMNNLELMGLKVIQVYQTSYLRVEGDFSK